jgi:hypothetical protein
MGVGNSRADYATPLYPQTLALTSPTSDGRSVCIVIIIIIIIIIILLSNFLRTIEERVSQVQFSYVNVPATAPSCNILNYTQL